MRAATYERYGDPTVITVRDRPKPAHSPSEILIRVAAAAVNPLDSKLRSGALHSFMPMTLPAVPGQDASGVVEAVGVETAGVAVGDGVFGISEQGTTAELAVLSSWAAIPPAWSFEQAAAAGFVSVTAIRALNALGLHDGGTLLIEGASGGVGTAAAQIARARGAFVIGTGGEERQGFLASIGVTPTPYGAGLTERVWTLCPGGVDFALDAAGSGSLRELVSIVGNPDRVVSIADRGASALGVKTVSPDLATGFEALQEAAKWGAHDLYVPSVSETFPLDRAADAHARIDRGGIRGKVVITVP
jgi:NADPH:quinone reductase-like Zn-dependent oxidoreductase